VVGSDPKVGENLLRHEPQLRPGTDEVRIRVRVRVKVRVRVRVNGLGLGVMVMVALSGLMLGLLDLTNLF
jgi:hypothetical protein